MPEQRHLVLASVIAVKDARVVYPCCGGCYSKLLEDQQNKRYIVEYVDLFNAA